MANIQVVVHAIAEDEYKVKELIRWDAAVQERLHYVGCGDWYSNSVFDDEDVQDKAECKSLIEFLKEKFEDIDVLIYKESVAECI